MTQSNQIRTLVVGCGSIGERHINNLRSLGVVEIAAYDTDPERLMALRDKYSVTTYDDLDDAIGTCPQLSLICVPNHMHLPIAMQLAQRGSHLFIEKPLTDRVKDIPALVRIIEELNLVCLVGCNMRFHPAIVRIREGITSGQIGRVLSIRMHFGHYLPNWRPNVDYRKTYSAQLSQGGGVILDAIHEIDYLRWLGGEVEEVFSYAARVGDLEMDVEDTADILFRLTSGAHAALHLDYLDQVKRRSCEVVGTKGTLIWRSVGKQPEQAVFEHHTNNEDHISKSFVVDPNAPYMAEMQHLLQCIAGIESPSLGVRDAWADLLIADAVHQSAAHGRPEQLQPVWNGPLI